MKRTILVIDDSPTNLTMLNELLKDDYHIMVSKSGSKALELLNQAAVDLILLDVVMPEMDGYQVCQHIRGQEAFETIPIIFLTALNEVSDEEKGLCMGAVDYITKPFSPPIVKARVETQMKLLEKTKVLKETLSDLEHRNQFIKKTFGKYLSDDIVTEILSKSDGLHLGGEERDVTILFSDLRGFTSMCESLGPKEVVWIINSYLQKMTEIIHQFRGTITEFIGDAVLAIFGAPIQGQDDPLRAMACAIEMQNAMIEVNDHCRAYGYKELHMGIGIHSGKVIVGNIGSSDRLKYGIIGHNVNLASRVESYTVGEQILISEATYHQYSNQVEVKETIEISPKGMKEPLKVFDLVGLRGTYNIRLTGDRDQKHLRTFNDPINLKVELLDGKHGSRELITAKLLRISPSSTAELEVDQVIQEYTDMKISLMNEPGEMQAADLYAKKIKSTTEASIHHIQFTVLPDDLREHLLKKAS